MDITCTEDEKLGSVLAAQKVENTQKFLDNLKEKLYNLQNIIQKEKDYWKAHFFVDEYEKNSLNTDFFTFYCLNPETLKDEEIDFDCFLLIIFFLSQKDLLKKTFISGFRLTVPKNECEMFISYIKKEEKLKDLEFICLNDRYTLLK